MYNGLITNRESESKMKIQVIHQTQYNGVELVCNDELPQLLVNECEETIVNHGQRYYDEDGCYQGDMNQLENFSIQTVKEIFGNDVEVTFEEDNTSS